MSPLWPWQVRGDDSTDVWDKGGPTENPFTRNLSWIIRALGLKSNKLPSQLKVPDVISVLDQTQNGWPLATYDLKIAIVVGGGPANRYFDLLANPGNTAAPVSATAGAGAKLQGEQARVIGWSGFAQCTNAGFIQLDLYHPQSAASNPVLLQRFANGSPAGTWWDDVELMDGHSPFLVPEGHGLELGYNFVLAAGDAFQFNFIIQRMPAGVSFGV